VSLFLLHGAVRGPLNPPTLPGAFGEPVAALEAGSLRVIASPAGNDADALQARFADAAATAELALAHNRILASLAPSLDIAPVALGAVVTLAGLPGLLAQRRSALEAALARIAGCVEYGVKLFAPARGEAVSPSPAPAADSGGRAYLQRLQQARQQRRAARQSLEEFEADVRARCAALAQERVELASVAGPRGRPLLSLALLVARAHAGRFEDEAAALFEDAQQLGLSLEASGPWPAYSFTTAEPEVAA